MSHRYAKFHDIETGSWWLYENYLVAYGNVANENQKLHKCVTDG